jgi:hypothetical protein
LWWFFYFGKGVSYSLCPALVTEEFKNEVGLTQFHIMTGAEKRPVECVS